eukprot:597896-Rhodomonas_salina.2
MSKLPPMPSCGFTCGLNPHVPFPVCHVHDLRTHRTPRSQQMAARQLARDVAAASRAIQWASTRALQSCKCASACGVGGEEDW